MHHRLLYPIRKFTRSVVLNGFGEKFAGHFFCPTTTFFTANITVDDVLELFENELKRRLGHNNKQYVAVSEIFYKNGLRLPVKELGNLARDYTVPTPSLTPPTAGE